MYHSTDENFQIHERMKTTVYMRFVIDEVLVLNNLHARLRLQTAGCVTYEI